MKQRTWSTVNRNGYMIVLYTRNGRNIEYHLPVTYLDWGCKRVILKLRFRQHSESEIISERDFVRFFNRAIPSLSFYKRLSRIYIRTRKEEKDPIFCLFVDQLDRGSISVMMDYLDVSCHAELEYRSIPF
jgi:hypothetical protein